jgi:hypothetical protein
LSRKPGLKLSRWTTGHIIKYIYLCGFIMMATSHM